MDTVTGSAQARASEFAAVGIRPGVSPASSQSAPETGAVAGRRPAPASPRSPGDAFVRGWPIDSPAASTHANQSARACLAGTSLAHDGLAGRDWRVGAEP